MLSAIMIANGDVRCSAVERLQGQFHGEAHFYRDGEQHSLVLSVSEASDTAEDALLVIEDSVKQIREWHDKKFET